MEGLDGGFECDAQETRGLWIEPLPIQIMSDRHIVENSSAHRGQNMVPKGTLVGRVSDQKPILLVYFFRRGELRCKYSGKRLGDQPKDEAEHRDWGQWRLARVVLSFCRQSTLVTYTHLGHSYPIRPGPLPNGGICSNDSHDGLASGTAELPDGPAE